MESKPSKPRLGTIKYVEPYDFRQPKLFSKEIMRTLRTLHDVLARNLSRVFSSTLRQKVDVYLYKIDQISTADFIHNLKSPTVIYLLNVEQLGGEVITVLPPALCIHIIERQSGGQGKDFSERRTLTTIEEKVTSRVMKNIKREIQGAWESYMDFDIEKVTYESKPENVHVASVDPTIVANFQVDIGDKSAKIRISYPYSLLKEAMNDSVLKPGNHSKKEQLSADEMDRYKHTISHASMRVQPLLGTSRLSVDEILNLKEGDAIALNQRTDRPLEVRVNGVKKMTAYPGLVQGRRAVKIYELVEEINEQELL